MQKKGKGKGVMKSCWIDSLGILSLSDDQWTEAKRHDPGFPQSAFFTLQFSREWDYYNHEKFERDLEYTLKIARIRYPDHRIVMIFDNSSVHRKFAANALNVSVMNKKPGGKQPILRNTSFNGRIQTFAFPHDHPNPQLRGVAKGIEVICEERGFAT